MTDYVPLVILENILSRVPLKCIARFKCVSKAWNTILGDRMFLNSHFERSIEHNNDDNSNLQVVLSVANKLCTLDFKTCTPKLVQVNPACELTMEVSNIWGSCNGLLCMSTGAWGGNLYLWNPYTREYKLIPYFPLASYVAFGFGYNSTRKDYEIVAISCYGYESEVQVYSLRNNSWRKSLHIPYGSVYHQGKFVHGALHWKSKTWWNALDISIIAYDMNRETFAEVPKPEYIDKTNPRWVGVDVAVFSEYLCFLINNYAGNLEVWIMVEYGVKESWTKKFNISTGEWDNASCMVPLCFIKHGAEILMSYSNGLYLCNMKCQRNYDERLNSYEFSKGDQIQGITTYTESMVRLFDPGEAPV